MQHPAKYDTTDWRASRNEMLLSWMLGNHDAVEFLVTLSSIIETWDDLIDKDTPVSDDAINDAFFAALFSLQLNPFFTANKTHLLPMLVASVNAWLDSVEMERGTNPHERMWSFFLKDYGRELFIQCAFIVGGFAHMRKVSMEMRRFFTHETYEEWEHRYA